MDSLAHYHQTHSSAVALDLSHFGKLSLTGADRATFLQNFTTNDIIKPGVGGGCESFLTTAQAKIVAWLRVGIRADDIYLTMEPGVASKVTAHLQRYLIAEDVQFDDRSESDMLWHLCGTKVFQQLPESVRMMELWQPWQNGSVILNGSEVWLQRCDFLGLPGCFLSTLREGARDLQLLLQGHAIPLIPHGDAAWSILRLEAGTPAFGADFDETNLPQEVNRTEQAISFTKGCYIGQETVARIRAYGPVNRLLVGIKLTTGDHGSLTSPHAKADEEWSGGKLFHQSQEVGVLKSVVFSPCLDSLLAFAFVRREFSSVGTKLAARTATKETEGEVVAFPL